MSAETQTRGAAIAAFIMGMLLVLPFTAWVGKTLWWWFAVPFGAPAVGTWHALGILIFWSWWRKKPDTGKLSIGDVCGLIGSDAAFLGLGAVAHWLMVRP